MSDLMAKWEKIQTIQDFAFILSLDSVTMEVKGKMRDILKQAQLGQPAPNLELVDLASKAKVPLLSLAKLLLQKLCNLQLLCTGLPKKHCLTRLNTIHSYTAGKNKKT